MASPRKAQSGRGIVGDRVFLHRREDADRQRDAPGGEKGGEGEHQGERHALPDQLLHRLLPFEAQAEVAAQHDAGDPFPVLHDHRLVEAEALA